MVYQTYGLHAGRLSRKHRNHENDENDEGDSDNCKQGVECWINGNHGNHGNDNHHGNQGCKSRVPQTTGLEIPDCKPLPPKFRGSHFTPKFRGRPSKKTIEQGISDTPSPKFWGRICHTQIRKILVSVKFVSAILGPEMAAPILWTPGKMRPFCRKNHVHKIPRFFGGAGFWVLGGGEVPILFLWARGFSEQNLRGMGLQGKKR